MNKRRIAANQILQVAAGDKYVWVLNFDGIDDALTIGVNKLNSVMSGISGATYMCWIYPLALPAGIKIFLRQTMHSVGSTHFTGYYVYFNGASLTFASRSDSGDVFGNVILTVSDVGTLNQWQHIATVADFTAKTLRIYKNGVEVGLATGVGFSRDTYLGGTPTRDDALVIAGNNAYNGKYAEMKFVGSPCTEEEINNEMCGNNGASLLYYKANEGAGQVIKDYSGNEFDGTLVGGTWEKDKELYRLKRGA